MTESEKLLLADLNNRLEKVDSELCELAKQEIDLRNKRYRLKVEIIKLTYGIEEGSEIIDVKGDQYKIACFDRFHFGVQIIGNKIRKDGTYGTARRIVRLWKVIGEDDQDYEVLKK